MGTVPQTSRTANFSSSGQELSLVLEALGKTYGVSLSAGKSLGEQRVTLYVRDASLEEACWGIEELLTPDATARVSWSKHTGQVWRLEESLGRQRLRERLQNHDLELYREFLEQEIRWAQRNGQQELDAASENGREVATGTPPRARVLRRLVLSSFLDWIGLGRRAGILQGIPVATQLSEMPGVLRKQFREYLTGQFPHLEALRTEQLDQYTLVYQIARHPTDQQGTRLVEALITPEGFINARGTTFGIPHVSRAPQLLRLTSLPPPDARNHSRKVSVNLSPTAAPRSGMTVARSLDALLGTISEATGLNVIADGYLRPQVNLPPNLTAEDYPITQLLDWVTSIWGCQWRFMEPRRETILVRAENWWLEDSANVPQSVIGGFQKTLGPGQDPPLGDLLQLAELTGPQLHKLMALNLLPAAGGIVWPRWYDATGPKPCLQFFSRLPAPLQQQAQSRDGLPLRAAPSVLVHDWLLNTLISEVGAVTSMFREDLVFSLRPAGKATEPAPGWQISIRNPNRRGSNGVDGRVWHVGPPRQAHPTDPPPLN